MHVPRPRWGRLSALVASALALSLLGGAPALAHPGHEHDADDPRVLIFTKTTQFRHTEAITQGTPVLQQALSEAGIDSVHTEDSAVFSDEGLADFDALVMFQTSGDPWDAEQKAALERYQQAGGGIVAIHNATDMRGNYAWWDEMIGALMPGHAATGSSPGLPGTVRVEDQVHPSTKHLPQRWERADEWYNYSVNVRGEAHVLATMDESTYDPGGNAMGYDHPISWCRPYDGGRAWMTGMGHFGAHYSEPGLVQHIIGGVQWAAGLAEGDCGGTDDSQYEKVTLDSNTSAPYAMDVAPDGRVFYTEIVRGQIRVYDPTARTTSTAVTIPVYSGGEDGLLGIALDPAFADNGHLYVYYSPASANDSDPANFVNRLSRLTVTPGTSSIDRASERVLLEVPARRLPDEPGHTGGALDVDAEGNLYLGVGDDVNPHSEPSGGYAPLSERDGTFHDARATSANTNDLRGKVLRIKPEADGTYSIPEGNLFAPGTERTRPEIYAMGFRNPFRFSLDPETGVLGVADYSPDNSQDNPDRGPAGIAEYNLISEPGFYGWPLCMADNRPFLDVDYRTSPVTVGPAFDCAEPVNDSIRNTGLTELPPAQPAAMWYGYQTTSDAAIPQGGGLAPMGGPFYSYDPALESDTKFPEYYDGKPFFYDWARNTMFSVVTNGARTDVEKVNPFLPEEEFFAPIDSKFGPEGSLYVLDWGGGYGRDNPDSGLHRIDYIQGSRSPSAVAAATPDSGPAPLQVTFSPEGSADPEGGALTYAWDFDGDGTTDSTDASPTHTYPTNGVFDARLTVTDTAGKTGTTTVPITVGNTRPRVEFGLPPDGAFFEFGDTVSWDVRVTDAEDGEIDDSEVIIQPALGHDYHAHPSEPLTGRTGSVTTSLGGGHGEDMDVFYVLDARYTDEGGDGAPALTGSDTSRIYGKVREAEFASSRSEDVTTAPSRDVEGHASSIAGQDGAWAAYDPVNLRGIDALVVRAASATGGPVELRRGAVDGELLGTAEVPPTGGASRYVDVRVDVTDPGETFALYLVMPGEGERRVNFLEAKGKGLSPTTRPEVAVTAPAAGADLEVGPVRLTAEATDAENSVTRVDFLVDGEVVGSDTTAPYEATWDAPADGSYRLTAVATNDRGATTTSRIVVAEVGDLFQGWETFTNAGATFERPDSDTWVITSGGANTWQSTDEYGAAFRPAGADGEWSATVKVDSQGASDDNAKAGIVVRNDMTQPGTSAGYGLLAVRPTGGVEWLRDTDGNGQLDASSASGTTAYPTWLRLSRTAAGYQASYSSDGESWTPVGGPVQLAGAAAVQDVGLLVTAHSTTVTSTAAFTGFAVGAAPEPEPEPEPAPRCPVPGTDEFDGDSLDTTRWTTLRQADGAALDVAAGALALPVAQGDINEGAQGPISYAGQPTRPGAWEVTTKLTLAHSGHWQHAGLLQHATDDEYVKLAFTRMQDGSRVIEWQSETGGARTWHDQVALPQDTPTTIHLKLVSDGTALSAAYSVDGTVWTALEGTTPVEARSTTGVMAAGDTAAPTATALVDWFRVAPDDEPGGEREPSDEFEGDALDPCRWDAITRYDSRALAVADGELRITTQPGDINGTANEGPRNFVLQEVPEGDWTIETRLRATMAHQYQLAGLLAYGGDDDYVKLDIVAQNASGQPVDLRAELVSETGADFGGGGNRSLDVPETTESGWFQLRLSKTGSAYSGEVSVDGTDWTPIGEPVTHEGALSTVGLMAIGPLQTAPATVAFDWFRHSGGGTEEPDTTAPVVQVTTDPAQPAGLAGWHTGPVTVSATGTDDRGGTVLLEHQVGTGDWTEHTGPVTVTAEGRTAVQVRGTDEAGNVSEPVALEVALDSVAPQLRVRGVRPDQVLDLRTTVRPVATATDATSGVASVQLALDGQPVTSGRPVVPAVGAHTLVAVATDAAGHRTTVTLRFTVVADYDGVQRLVSALHAERQLSTSQLNQLRNHVGAALRASTRGQAQQERAALDRAIAVARRVSGAAARGELVAALQDLRRQV